MKSQNSNRAPKTINSKKEIPWFEKIDFWSLIKKSLHLINKNRKKLILLGLYLLLTGGQAITVNTSFFQNAYPATEENKDKATVEEKGIAGAENTWEEILKDIESQEDLKTEFRSFFEDEKKVSLFLGFFIVIILLIIVMALITFFFNSHFHLLYLKTLASLEERPLVDQKMVREKIRGRWKELSWMRLIFGFFYFISLLIFLSPAAFFFTNSSNFLLQGFFGLASFGAVFTFTFISYVFRYSLLYFAEEDLSFKESIDRGYELFRSKWRESLLASLINFAAGTLFLIFSAFVITLLVSVEAAIGLAGYFLLKNIAFASVLSALGIFIAVFSVMILILLLASLWQCFVLNFWFLFFREIAGKKIFSPEELISLENKKKLAELAVKKETDENLKNI